MSTEEGNGGKKMTAKEYLSQYTDCLAEIETLTEEVMRLRSLAMKVTVAFDSDGSAAGTRSTDKLERCVDKILESETRMNARINDLSAIRQDVFDTIMKVQDGRLRTLLLMRYISGTSFEGIAAKMGYTYKHTVNNLHPEALQEVEKIIS
jgi:hypothetical protein